MLVPLTPALFKGHLYIVFPTHGTTVTPSTRKMTRKLIKRLHPVQSPYFLVVCSFLCVVVACRSPVNQNEQVDYLPPHIHYTVVGVQVTDLFALYSKFTFSACSMKMYVDPLNTFIFPAGTGTLSVEGTGETLQEETCFRSWFRGSLALWVPEACVVFSRIGLRKHSQIPQGLAPLVYSGSSTQQPPASHGTSPCSGDLVADCLLPVAPLDPPVPGFPMHSS